MRLRHHLLVFSTVLSICLISNGQFAAADTCEFELIREVARSETTNLNLGSINANVPSGVAGAAGKFVFQAPEKSNLTVKTGPDALFILGRDCRRIYDFKNMKIYDLNEAAKTYDEHSLYADLAYRKAKLQSCLAVREVISKALKGKYSVGLSPAFFAEALYALSPIGRNTEGRLEKLKEGTTDTYKFNSVVVTRFTPCPEAVSPDKMRQFSRFLIYGTHLHPAVREDMEKSGKLPQKLNCYLDNRPVLQERSSLSLKKLTPGDYAPALPSGYSRTIEARNPLAPVYARIKELKETLPAELLASTLEHYKNAVGNKNYFDALLALSEYGLETGQDLSKEMKEIREAIKSDPDCVRLIAGVQSFENEKQALGALAALDGIDRSRSSKSYLVDIYRANLIIAMKEHGVSDPSGKSEEDPVSLFVKVLRQNPFIVSAYHDLGEYFESTSQQSYAWECYDLARRFYPRHPFLKDIAEREQELYDSFPQFFLGDKL
jgi:hypothetical protein